MGLQSCFRPFRFSFGFSIFRFFSSFRKRRFPEIEFVLLILELTFQSRISAQPLKYRWKWIKYDGRMKDQRSIAIKEKASWLSWVAQKWQVKVRKLNYNLNITRKWLNNLQWTHHYVINNTFDKLINESPLKWTSLLCHGMWEGSLWEMQWEYPSLVLLSSWKSNPQALSVTLEWIIVAKIRVRPLIIIGK